MLFPDTSVFIAEFDAAIESHMDWTRRVLRCAVLRTSPGEDVLEPLAHNLCRFGHWFNLNEAQFEEIEIDSARRIEAVHKTMHDAIRSICTDVVAGIPGRSTDLVAFEQSQSELLVLLARLKTLLISNAVQHDPLTGLPLRHKVDNDFALCLKEANRMHTLLYVVMIDVDHFKRINDVHGHPVGDLVLRHLAGTLKSALRGNEPLYRFGGEEFLWLMRCESAQKAEQAARRIVTTIRTTSVPIPDNESLALTVTLGLAQVGRHEDITSAIKRADRALYAGKRAGRDQYSIAKD